MLTLKTKNFTLPANIPQEIKGSFKKPLIFYLAHKKDKRAFFITFVILDFSENKLRYIVSYLPENIEKIKNHPRSEIFRIKNTSIANPHCTVSTKGDASFLTFVEYTSYFFKVNSKKNTLLVYTDEYFEKTPGEFVMDFSPTNYADKEKPNCFYFSSLHANQSRENLQKTTFILWKASLEDLSKIDKIYTEENYIRASPHVIRKVGRYFISSDFLGCGFKNLKNGLSYKSNHAYASFVYNSLYVEYCKKEGLPVSADIFKNKTFFQIVSAVKSMPGFSSFCSTQGKNFLEICKRNQKYAFSALLGTITLLDSETKEKKIYETTFCAPAHFEVDEKSGDIFASSHNFIPLEKTYFLGPAAIDRFHLENGELKKISTFTHPQGYRFTSHKVFSYGDKTYICTFGQPNRLFLIDADTMELEFYEDIGEDFLSKQTDVANFLNYAYLDPFTIKSIEVSPDGKYILFMSYDYLYFYSFLERKIVHKISYTAGSSPDREIDLENFYKKTTHLDYLN